MAGPPTPPPTTDTEIQDAARAEPATQSPTHPPAEDDPYRNAFPIIAELASQSDFQSLIKAAENSDLNGDADSSRRTTRLLVAAPLVLSYLIVDDLPPARYALTRLPENLLLTPLGQCLVNLVASTMERKHANIYSQAQNLFNVASQQVFFDEKLTSVVTALVLTFLETFRSRTFALLSRAYTSLSLSLAQMYLGLTAEQVLIVVEKNQWSYDASSNILSPKPSAKAVAPTIPAFSSLSTFHFVASSVAKLEL